MADWSSLPNDLLRLIRERVKVFLPDFHRFSSVCLEWHSIARETECPPLVLLPFDNSTDTCNFFNIKGRDIIGIHLPELHNRTCCSTSHGWLVTLNDELDIQLFHLYTRAQIPLPRRECYAEVNDVRPSDPIGRRFFHVRKVVLSANPADSLNDCVVASIGGYSDEFAFCKLGDKKWIRPKDRIRDCNDIIFYKSKIYAVNKVLLHICDVNEDPEVTEVAGPVLESIFVMHYLVESLEGDLFCVLRYLEHIIPYEILDSRRNYYGKKKYRTKKFSVFKLVDTTHYNSSKNWTTVDCLGDQVLFVGPNHSFGVRADAFPQFRRNCIYFTEDYLEGYVGRPYGFGCHDAGVFNMQDGSVRSFYPDAPYWQVPPLWFKQT